MFLGEIHGFGLQILPEFARERNVVPARGQPLDEERFKPRIVFAIFSFAQQRAEIFAHIAVTISLPESLRTFIDEQLATKGYGNVSEYFRSLLREAKDREDDARLEALLTRGSDRRYSGLREFCGHGGARNGLIRVGIGRRCRLS